VFWQPLGQIPAWIAWGFLRFTTAVVRWTAAFPHAAVTLEGVTPAMAWGYYGLLGIGTFWVMHPKVSLSGVLDSIRRIPIGWTATGVVAIALLVVALVTVPGGQLRVSALSVGNGDAFYVQTPRGRQVLIDGGPEPSRTLDVLGQQMPFWDRSLDLVILTSPDEGRLPGLVPVLERMDVSAVGYTPKAGEGPIYDRWVSLLSARPLGTGGMMTAGQHWILDQDVALEVLWPPPDQKGPLVLRVSYGETQWLVAGAATPPVEAALVARYGVHLRSNVLILPLPSSPESGSPAFLQAVDPEIVVASTGAGSPPSPYVLSRIADRRLFRTDPGITLVMRSDGRHIQVRQTRP
jgi:competence protein ComEC